MKRREMNQFTCRAELMADVPNVVSMLEEIGAKEIKSFVCKVTFQSDSNVNDLQKAMHSLGRKYPDTHRSWQTLSQGSFEYDKWFDRDFTHVWGKGEGL